jgi:ubiquinone/menaquinone biosynthesis C-methylase UbiE
MPVVQFRPHSDGGERTTFAEVKRIKSVYSKYAEREDPEKARRAGRQRMVRDRDKALFRLLDQEVVRPLSRYRILDLGCGRGDLIERLQCFGFPDMSLFGADLLPDSLAAAARKCPSVAFTEANAEHLPFPAQRFDFVLVFTVFSSILDPVMAGNVAREIDRVLTPDGAVIWYDMRYPNPWNRNIRAMTTRRIQSLFPNYRLELHAKTLIPTIAYRLGFLTEPLYPALASFPGLRSHYFGLLRRSPSTT